jgi:hypothetical protein
MLRGREQGPSGRKSTKKMNIAIESNVPPKRDFHTRGPRQVANWPAEPGLESFVSITFIPFSRVLPSGTVFEVRYVS